MHPRFRPHRHGCPFHKWPCPCRCDLWELGLIGPAELVEPQLALYRRAVRAAQRRARSILTLSVTLSGPSISSGPFSL